MLVLPCLLLLLFLPWGSDAGALPLFFRHMRLPYFGHGAGGRLDSSATTKMLLSERAGAAAAELPQARGGQGGEEPRVRPLEPKEHEQHPQEQQHQPNHLPRAFAGRGANIIVPPPKGTAGSVSASSPSLLPSSSSSAAAEAAAAHPLAHHWGLRGDGHRAFMAGRWTEAGKWHTLEVSLRP